MKKALFLVSALSLSVSAFAEKVAIVGADVYTMTTQGIVKGGTVLLNDDKIEKVIAGTDAPSGYRVIDAAGKVVTPGFIGAHTSLGLVEVGMSAGTVDSSTKASLISGTGAAFDVSYAVNPDSSLIGITRLEGFTSAATTITRGEGLFNGQGAVITLDGKATPVLKPRAFMSVDVGNHGADDNGGSRAALWVALEQAIAEAESVKGTLSATSDWNGINTPADITALKAVVSGKAPLFMSADRAADIRQVIAFKARHPKINVVLVHAVDGWRVADEIAKHDIPVIIDPEYNLPGGFDQMGATLANAGRLAKAGVNVAIGMDTHNIRLAAQHAGNAVANGLPHLSGIAALTSVPAQILGMSGEIGELSAGAKADVVIWSGDPLEVTEAAEQVFIDGEAMPMESRQTKLRDRYLTKTSNAHTPQYIRQ